MATEAAPQPPFSIRTKLLAASGILLVGSTLLYGYVASRLLHFAAYFTAQPHDVRATLWTVGSVILIFMTGWTLFAALGA